MPVPAAEAGTRRRGDLAEVGPVAFLKNTGTWGGKVTGRVQEEGLTCRFWGKSKRYAIHRKNGGKTRKVIHTSDLNKKNNGGRYKRNVLA